MCSTISAIEENPELKFAFEKKGIIDHIFHPFPLPSAACIVYDNSLELTPDNYKDVPSIYDIYPGWEVPVGRGRVRRISKPGAPLEINRIVCSKEAYEKLATELAERFGLDEIETDY